MGSGLILPGALLHMALLVPSVLHGAEGRATPPDALFLYQDKAECRYANGTAGEVRFLDRHVYNRQEYVRFDSRHGWFEAVTELGEPDAQYWNSHKKFLDNARAAVDFLCRYNYKVYKEFFATRKGAHSENLPHQGRPTSPPHPPDLHCGRILPLGDPHQVAEERAGADGGSGLLGEVSERRLDLPGPGAAGDGARAGRHLCLPGGAQQREETHHCAVGAAVVELCPEQSVDGGCGGRPGGGLGGPGSLLLSEDQASGSRSTSSRAHPLVPRPADLPLRKSLPSFGRSCPLPLPFPSPSLSSPVSRQQFGRMLSK
ncbi:uncharacterized protein LOC143834082 isoform X2 [Paroedura picta]|uniref:uncharacterized protein LOC143834082 isoform X2 n=1 Tax=Paroedura picta TaxID=143630 RepID=UPI004055F743